MADNDKPVDDTKPTEEHKVKKPPVKKPKAKKPASSPATPVNKAATPAGTDQLGRQLYNVICAACGKQTQVPFKPTGDRPVYCRDCYMKQRRGRTG